MSITVSPGARIFSSVDASELIVVKAPSVAIALTIGGVPAVLSADDRTDSEPVTGHDGGTAIGKRYVDREGTVELLVTRPGIGVPALEGELLNLKESKPLPASD